MFIFTLLCCTLKGFMKAFIKPFEASQKRVKMNIKIHFSLFVQDRDGKV